MGASPNTQPIFVSLRIQFLRTFDRIGNRGCLVYPLRIDGSELTSIEDGIDRLREICGDTRFEHITARAQLKSRVHKIDVFVH